ncbi:putative peptidase family-domain-containing protein [Podospora conica]|nr:putative peptidase family-domain-containing protein [Schizothecium conicum]
MLLQTALLSLLLHGATQASPIRQSSPPPPPPFPIHSSCNITLHNQLSQALEETVQLAQQAKSHLLLHGLDSPLVQKYFGNHSTAAPIGWYDRIISADRGTEMLFRCDDPDKNCATQDGWAGHHRGSNATQETVICPLSFQPGKRRHLDAVCGWGHTVSGSPLNEFWAVDLLHRILHVPRISEGVVDHFADDYAQVLTLAKSEPEKAARDSEALQFFALEVWSVEVAVPGVGCLGKAPEGPAKVPAPVPTPAADAGKACHTHSDGVVHCD